MRIDGPQITGSFSLNGDGLPDLDVLATTSSLNTYTSSIDTTMGHVMTATHSLNTFTSSASSRLSTIESTTGSLNSFSNSINSYTSSNDSTNTTQNSRLNSIEGATGSYATTGSNTFNGNLTVTGFIEAQELRTTYISSSILYRSGSTKFGDELSDTHAFTGSLNISGSVNVGSAPIESNATRIKINNTEIGTVSAYGSNNNGDPIIIIKNSATGNALTINPNELGNFSYFYPSGLVSINSLNVSGSTKFGDELTDTHAFSGSVSISGSISVPGSGLVSGSSQITYSGLSGVPSGIVSGSAQVLAGTTIHSGSFFNGISVVSGSAQIDVMSTTNIARLATTGSNTFVGNQVVSGSFKVSGSIESSYDNLATEGGQLILRGPVNRYNVDNWSGNALRIFREDDATAANGNVIIFASGSGQVGINKNSTNSTLDVNGNTLVSGSLTATNMNVFGTTELAYVNGTTQMRISRSGAVARLQNYENGSVSNIILNWEGGNLGVGVTDPSTALDVYKIGSGGALTGAAMTLRSGNAYDTSGSQQILFSYSGTTLYRHSIRTRHMSDAAAGNAIDFYTWKYGTDVNSAIGTQHVMTIDGNAMVGIGTTTPGQTLELKSADGQGLRLKNAGSSDKRWDIVGSGNDLRINETGVGAVMTIKAGGTIGIGNTNPKFYLHSNDDVTIPNNRYLNFTSEINAANFNKSLVVSYTDDSATSQPNQLGLILHNNSNTDNTFSPALVFGSKSASNNYSQATAAIAGKRITLQQDPNWHSGELYFWTATSGGSSINQGIPADAPAMILDSRRRMRVPSQPSFQVHRGNAANFTISNTSDGTVLPFNVVRHDSASNYNNSTYRFTAPIGGRYFFSATVRWDGSSSGSYLRTFFTVNGSSGQGGSAFNYGHAINGPSGYSSNYQSLTVSAVIQLAAGDYVSVVGGINVGSTDMHAESQFSGYMLG